MVLPRFICKRSVDFRLCGSVSGLSVLFHWFIRLLFVQYHSLDYCSFRVSKSSEKAMATHSSTLAWKIPRTEEPGRLQSMGSLRVGHNWATSLSLFTFLHWRRKWQATPVFLRGESQGWRSLVGCRLWGRTELDTTEATQQQQQQLLHCRQTLYHLSHQGGPFEKWV